MAKEQDSAVLWPHVGGHLLRVQDGLFRRAGLRSAWRLGDYGCNLLLAVKSIAPFSEPGWFVQVEGLTNPSGPFRHLDDRKHEGPVDGDVDIASAQLQIVVGDGVEQTFAECAKVLPHVAPA